MLMLYKEPEDKMSLHSSVETGYKQSPKLYNRKLSSTGNPKRTQTNEDFSKGKCLPVRGKFMDWYHVNRHIKRYPGDKWKACLGLCDIPSVECIIQTKVVDTKETLTSGGINKDLFISTANQYALLLMPSFPAFIFTVVSPMKQSAGNFIHVETHLCATQKNTIIKTRLETI